MADAPSVFLPVDPRSPESSLSTFDSALLARVEEGDEETIVVFYDVYCTVVYSIAISILGDFESAECVLHDTFMQLWREPSSFLMREGTLRASLAIRAYHGAIFARNQRMSGLSHSSS